MGTESEGERDWVEDVPPEERQGANNFRLGAGITLQTLAKFQLDGAFAFTESVDHKSPLPASLHSQPPSYTAQRGRTGLLWRYGSKITL